MCVMSKIIIQSLGRYIQPWPPQSSKPGRSLMQKATAVEYNKSKSRFGDRKSSWHQNKGILGLSQKHAVIQQNTDRKRELKTRSS